MRCCKLVLFASNNATSKSSLQSLVSLVAMASLLDSQELQRIRVYPCLSRNLSRDGGESTSHDGSFWTRRWPVSRMVTRRASVSPMASRRIVEILSGRDQTKTASSHRLLIVGQTLRQQRMKVNMKLAKGESRQSSFEAK